MKGVFIAGIESPLSAAVCAEAEIRAERCAAAIVPNHFAASGNGGEKHEGSQPPGKIVPLEWNPGSPVSTRGLVLAAENRVAPLELAIMVCSAPPLRRLPEDISPADAEIIANEYIKGWFFLTREIAAYFSARGSVTPEPALALVLAETASAEKGEIADLGAAPVAASFRALAQGIIASQGTRPWNVFGFSTDRAAEDSEFAAFIFRTIHENGPRASGKWNKYGKFPLFK